MTPEELLHNEANRWLVQAKKDLTAAEAVVTVEPSRSLFHSQQAAEKSAKAFLAYHNVPFRNTHELRELGVQCAKIDTTLAALIDEAEDLTNDAVAYRYPNVLQEPDEDEATAALAKARGLYDQVRTRLGIS